MTRTTAIPNKSNIIALHLSSVFPNIEPNDVPRKTKKPLKNPEINQRIR